MVRRLSVAGRDRGSESPVYGAKQSRLWRAPGIRPVGSRAPAVAAARRCALRVCGRPTDSGPRLALYLCGLDGSGQAARSVERTPSGRDAPVVDRARQRMVCKGHPCIYMADGDSVTQFGSSKVVSCGHRRPRKLSDVHGREG